MYRNNRSRFLRRAMLFVLASVAAIMLMGVGSANAVLPGPGPAGVQCSVDTFTFYGLGNSIHPSEIGFKTVLGCNYPATLVGHQWLLNAGPNGSWNSIYETYAQKSKSNVLALTMESWYKCGSVDTYPSNHLESKASWDMNFNNGYNTYGDNATEHWSKCYFPSIVSFQ